MNPQFFKILSGNFPYCFLALHTIVMGFALCQYRNTILEVEGLYLLPLPLLLLQ